MQYHHVCKTMHCTYHIYSHIIIRSSTVSRNRWIAIIPGKLSYCNIYSLGPAKAVLVQASTEPVGYVGICNTQIYLKELENDHLMSSIWVFNVHCSRCSACVASLQHATILSADAPLNEHCLFHFQGIHQLWTYPYLLTILITIPFSSTHHSFGMTQLPIFYK